MATKETYQQIMCDLQEVAKNILPCNAHMYLYGSRARGEAHEDSDWDILILLDQNSVNSEDFNNFAYPLVELGWKLNAAVSPQIYTLKEWSAMSFMPYHKNVEHDKIVLV